MTRTIRPVGPVTPPLAKAGYRQYAAVIVDGKQVRNVAILSTQVGDRIKFVGHYIDANGEVHKTKPMNDMKRAAARIMGIIEQAPAPVAKQAAKRKHTAAATVHSIGAMIDCRGCGTRHADDTMCPED